ncbi:hypothetical protein AOLI_G00072270 [Acnodon oligacanthus]
MQKQGAPFKGEKGDLIDTLQVAVGARVMFTRNSDVQDGLVNGCFGTVAKIITQTRDSVPLVQMVGLELDNTNAGQKRRNKVPGGSDNIVYIEREEESLRKKGTVRRLILSPPIPHSTSSWLHLGSTSSWHQPWLYLFVIPLHSGFIWALASLRPGTTSS